MKRRTIITNFPFESRFMKVRGSDLHYIDVGSGDPILFLHGVPASSYIWRNVIKRLSQHARCIAPDLIGMGKSDKPDIEYTIFDHVEYIEEFINALDLKNITLVLHGLGSIAGLAYAMRHPERIKALAFYESYLCPPKGEFDHSLPVKHLLSMLENKDGSYKAVVENNYLLKKLFTTMVLRKLSKEELEYYEAPFKKKEHRKVLWHYVQSIKKLHLGDLKDLLHSISEYLKNSVVPKLMMYSMPGFLTTMENVQWCCENCPNTEVVDLGDGHHFAQETDPHGFSDALYSWYERL